MPILAQTAPVFQPAMRVIFNITNTETAIIATTFDHQYEVGMKVRINLPTGYTMQELNQQVATILTIINPNLFVVDIDTTKLQNFSAPTEFPLNLQYAQVTPVGEINSQLRDATRNVLPY